eukprot:PhM_4_TR16061/c0_g1_i1/m.42089
MATSRLQRSSAVATITTHENGCMPGDVVGVVLSITPGFEAHCLFVVHNKHKNFIRGVRLHDQGRGVWESSASPSSAETDRLIEECDVFCNLTGVNIQRESSGVLRVKLPRAEAFYANLRRAFDAFKRRLVSEAWQEADMEFVVVAGVEGNNSNHSHVNSTQVAALTQRIEHCERRLRALGVYYDYPDDIEALEDRPVKYRAMHTRGNTKNQKRNLKRCQVRVLQTIADHLQAVLDVEGVR